MSDLANLNRTVQLSSAANDFFDYARARAEGKREGIGYALRFAQARGASARVQQMLEKAAVSAASIAGGTWGAELAVVEDASRGFLSLLPPFSALDRLLADHAVTPVPVHKRLVLAQIAAIASYVGEGAKKPLGSITISDKVMPLLKVVAMVAYTKEMLITKGSLVNDLFNSMLRNAVAQETDRKFLEIISEGTDVVSNPSSGTTADAFMHDLNIALRQIEVGVGSRLYLILPIREFNTASVLRDSGGPLIVNGMIGNIRVIPTSAETSSGVPITDAVLLDATAIGADGGIAIADGTGEADLEMDDNPTAGSQQLVSLWQTNRRAARVERYFGVTVLRPEGIAVIGDMDVTE